MTPVKRDVRARPKHHKSLEAYVHYITEACTSQDLVLLCFDYRRTVKTRIQFWFQGFTVVQLAAFILFKMAFPSKLKK